MRVTRACAGAVPSGSFQIDAKARGAFREIVNANDHQEEPTHLCVSSTVPVDGAVGASREWAGPAWTWGPCCSQSWVGLATGLFLRSFQVQPRYLWRRDFADDDAFWVQRCHVCSALAIQRQSCLAASRNANTPRSDGECRQSSGE